MSTYQPPGGQQPEPTPGYAQPQDPWEDGYEPGLASVPTDPIPQQYDPYGNAITQPTYAQGGVWSQQTVAQGGYQGYRPQPNPNRAGVIVLVSLIVVLLAGGGGFAAWWLTTHRPDKDPTTGPTTAGASASPSPSVTVTEPTAFDPFTVKVGDCLVNDNPGDGQKPAMRIVPCGPKGSFEVIKIVQGEDIAQDDDGELTEPEAQETCKGSGYTNYYKSDNDSVAQDIVFCMKENK